MSPVVLIIEDEEEIRQYILDLLQDHGFTPYAAATGTQGLKLVEKIDPEVVILDLKLPDIDGETVCKRIKSDHHDVKVVMLTAKGTPEQMARGLNLGADDYVAKPFSEDVLIARVKARLRRNQNNNEKLKIDDLVMDPQSHTVKRDKDEINLSPQEFKLLHYLMSNPGQVLTREMIISRIWGASPDIETRVVDVYIGYLRKKIDKPYQDKPNLIHSIRGFGYKMEA